MEWVALNLVSTPPVATHLVNTTHTVTATATASGNPAAGVTVNFIVLSGPRTGLTGSGVTNAAGQAFFNYTSSVPGIDTIVATIGSGPSVTSNQVTNTWCTCVTDLTARPKVNKAELRWTPQAGVHHYNIYRGTASGGPYTRIAAVQQGATGFYLDEGPLTIGTTYYYVIKEADAADIEFCTSNQASARPTGR